MINFDLEPKYHIDYTTKFKKQLKKVLNQEKNINQLLEIIFQLANKKQLAKKYKNHKLVTNKEYDHCYECHINPDWLLIY